MKKISMVGETENANEVKFYVDLEHKNISSNNNDFKADCILNVDKPYYYVEATNDIDGITEINKFVNPYDPSEYEKVKDACLDDSVDYTLEFNENTDDEVDNILNIALKKAKIIFNETLQKYELNIENVENDSYTIYSDGEVE